MPMTLMNYVTNKAGAWASSKQASNDNVIELTQADDAVTIQGPLSLNVSFVAEAVFSPVSGNGGTAQQHEGPVQLQPGGPGRLHLALSDIRFAGRHSADVGLQGDHSPVPLLQGPGHTGAGPAV